MGQLTKEQLMSLKYYQNLQVYFSYQKLKIEVGLHTKIKISLFYVYIYTIILTLQCHPYSRYINTICSNNLLPEENKKLSTTTT